MLPDATTAPTTTETPEAASTAASAASGTDTTNTTTTSGTAGTAASTDGQKPADAASSSASSGTQQPPAAPAVPESYDLKLPDGSTLGADFVTRTADIARALGLSNEAGQKLLDAQIAEIATARATVSETVKAETVKAMQPGGAIWEDTTAKWKEAGIADKEIGGTPEKLQASADLALKVVHRFATAETKKFFEDTGLGNHPELVRVFARIGKSMSESSLKLPNAGEGPAALTADERLARRYPTMVAKS